METLRIWIDIGNKHLKKYLFFLAVLCKPRRAHGTGKKLQSQVHDDELQLIFESVVFTLKTKCEEELTQQVKRVHLKKEFFSLQRHLHGVRNH